MSDYPSLLVKHFYAALSSRKLQLKNGPEEREYRALQALTKRNLVFWTGFGTCCVLSLDHYLGRVLFSRTFTAPRVLLLFFNTGLVVFAATKHSTSPRLAELAAILANRYEDEILSSNTELRALRDGN